MSIILFPYSQIPAHDLRNIITLFKSLRIFRPWYMAQSSSLDEFTSQQDIKILYPPEKLKPREEFKALLSEYYNWIQRNQDKSYKEILKRDQALSSSEDATWEIRHLMRQMGKDSASGEDQGIFNWHLILHLANEIEIQNMEADRLLRAIKDRKPLLYGSAEGVDPSASPVKDLPDFTSKAMLHNSQFSKIMEAWFCLFGQYLGDNEVFVTLNHQILDYIIEKWNAITNNDEPITDLKIRVKIPEFSDPNHIEKDEIRTDNVDPYNLDVFRRLITEIGEDPVASLPSIDAWSRDSAAKASPDTQHKSIDISIKYFPAQTNNEPDKGHEILELFSGKTLILMVEV